jgi:hypothetical protein
LKAANASIESSESLGIPIGADAMQMYLGLKRQLDKEAQDKKEAGIIFQISELFRNKKST